jgi:hypothetical protein
LFSSAEWFGTEFRESYRKVFSDHFVGGREYAHSIRTAKVEINLKGFLSHGTEFRVDFSSAEGFGTKFRDFLFRGTTEIPSEIAVCSVYSVFRGIIFLSEIPNPNGTYIT